MRLTDRFECLRLVRPDGSRRWHFWPCFVVVNFALGPIAGPVGLLMWEFIVVYGTVSAFARAVLL